MTRASRTTETTGTTGTTWTTWTTGTTGTTWTTRLRNNLRCQQHYFISQTVADVEFWVLVRAAWTRCSTMRSSWTYSSGGIDSKVVHADEAEDDGCTVDRISEADDDMFGDCSLIRTAGWGGGKGEREDSISVSLAPSFASWLSCSPVMFSSSKNVCGAIGPMYTFLRPPLPLANLN